MQSQRESEDDILLSKQQIKVYYCPQVSLATSESVCFLEKARGFHWQSMPKQPFAMHTETYYVNYSPKFQRYHLSSSEDPHNLINTNLNGDDNVLYRKLGLKVTTTNTCQVNEVHFPNMGCARIIVRGHKMYYQTLVTSPRKFSLRLLDCLLSPAHSEMSLAKF